MVKGPDDYSFGKLVGERCRTATKTVQVSFWGDNCRDAFRDRIKLCTSGQLTPFVSSDVISFARSHCTVFVLPGNRVNEIIDVPSAMVASSVYHLRFFSELSWGKVDKNAITNHWIWCVILQNFMFLSSTNCTDFVFIDLDYLLWYKSFKILKSRLPFVLVQKWFPFKSSLRE